MAASSRYFSNTIHAPYAPKTKIKTPRKAPISNWPKTISNESTRIMTINTVHITMPIVVADNPLHDFFEGDVFSVLGMTGVVIHHVHNIFGLRKESISTLLFICHGAMKIPQNRPSNFPHPI